MRKSVVGNARWEGGLDERVVEWNITCSEDRRGYHVHMWLVSVCSQIHVKVLEPFVWTGLYQFDIFPLRVMWTHIPTVGYSHEDCSPVYF